MDAQYTGNQISTLRRELGMTQKDLAQKLHVTDKAVSKWERGVNFPDLGLMENLAAALNTTPAYLLGLERADQTQTLSALAEISREQLDEARRDLRLFSWGTVLTALLLGLAYYLIQKRSTEVYFLLNSMIFVLWVVGQVYLYKYEQIKKWDVPELFSFMGAVVSLLVFFGYQFVTGASVPVPLTVVTLTLAAICTQIHFLQTMRPRLVQLLPLILSVLFAVWELVFGGLQAVEMIPLGCCAAVVGIHLWQHPEARRIHWKAVGIAVCILLLLVLIVCLLCYPDLVRAYILTNQQRLEVYAENLLESGHSDTYGLWDVTAYPELGMVAFQTGGSGIGSETNYEGFYYCTSGEHVPFPGFEHADETYGSDAWFRDPNENSDNWQHSTQIAPNWFWFTLHY